MKKLSLAFLCILLFLFACQESEYADLVLTGAKVITVDPQFSIAEAVAVINNKILAVGSAGSLDKFIGKQTKVLELKNRCVIPGLIEGHAHFMGVGYAKMNLNLMNADNWPAIVSMVEEAVGKAVPGEWILGRGWHQEKWNELPSDLAEGYPVHDALSKIAPDNPVLLTHASGHAILVNQKAMDLAKVSQGTPDPEGGRIVRKENGSPGGVFLENAESLIREAHSESLKNRTGRQIEAETLKAIELATEECLRYGITSFHDAGESFAMIDRFKKLADEHKLGVRLWVMIGEDNPALEEKINDYRLLGYGNQFLTVRSIKRFMDGALGARGAWLLEPYADLPSTSGLNTIDLNEMRETARIAAENGFQVCTHAIGDRGNRETLNIYEEAFQQFPDKTDRRWRIEHAQHLEPADIPRFAELGVIASMQGIHCTSDGPWVPKRIGDKRAEEGAYVWRKLLDSGAVVSTGTDAPVEAVDPFANFYALVTRKMQNGEAFYPEQVMSRQEALIASTINAAYSAFEEDIKGSIEPGKLADLTVLSGDILTIPDEGLPDIDVIYTIVDGKIKYANPELTD